MTATRSYPSDVKEEEWAFVAPYLALLREDAPPASAPIAGPVQCPALPGPYRLPMALPAERLAALGRRLPAVDAWRDARVFEDIVHD